jgi:PKD repeat protein
LPIQANFSAEPWIGPAPFEVSFTDLSTGGPISWNWNFGDSFSSTVQSPTHVFQNEGNYSVSLQVSNLQGDMDSTTRYVNATGRLRNMNLLTTRNGVLQPGSVSWLNKGSGSITVNNSAYDIQNGDRIRLDILKPQSFAKIVIAGGITTFNSSNISLSINDVHINTGTCTAISIPDFVNYHSNLQILAYRNNTALINFVWNSAPVTVPVYRNLEVSGIMPSTINTMEIDLKPAEIYLDGRASDYRVYS